MIAHTSAIITVTEITARGGFWELLLELSNPRSSRRMYDRCVQLSCYGISMSMGGRFKFPLFFVLLFMSIFFGMLCNIIHGYVKKLKITAGIFIVIQRICAHEYIYIPNLFLWYNSQNQTVFLFLQINTDMLPLTDITIDVFTDMFFNKLG